MINTDNRVISTSSSSANAQSPGLKTYFKTREGRYKLHYEKTHPSAFLHYSHGKTVTHDPIKSLHFSNSNPVYHALDQDSKNGHALLIGLNSGDAYSVSLRQQLQDVGKKLVGYTVVIVGYAVVVVEPGNG